MCADLSFFFQKDRMPRLNDHVGVIGMISHDKVTAAVATRRSLVVEELIIAGTVAKLMLSDVVEKSNNVWMMELSNGSVWCWSTPATCSSSSSSKKSKMALTPPVQIGSHPFSHVLGTISCVGDSAMWMLGSTSTQSQFVVGSIPSSNHGCILKVGQEGANHHRVVQGDSSHLEHEVFSLGKASITTPAFLASLLTHLLITPSDDDDDTITQSMLRAKDHFSNYLQPTRCGDTAFVTMRLLVLRSVELVTSLKKNKLAYSQARKLFSRVIGLLDEMLPPHAFAGLLLSLARQVEPSCMEHLFPLPSSQTIEDLYLECVRRGSLATPSATLPLLSTKLSALQECKEILYHCLLNLSSSFAECSSDLPFDTSREERQFVRDLFRFANQLEQMDEAEFWSDSKLDVTIMPTAHEKKQGTVLATPTNKTPQKKTRGFGILTPLICSGRRRREERAVYEAASTFIGSGFEEFEYDHVDLSKSEGARPVSVMYITGKLLVRLSLQEKHGWKKSAVIARLVLGDTAIDESGKGVVTWVQSMPLSSLAVTAHRLSRSKDYLDLTDSDEMADVVTDYLVQGMFAANHEMTRADAAWLLELVVLSLSRLSPRDTVNQSLAPGLVLMATIVGHVSGRMEDMVRDLKKKDANALMTCYEEAKRVANS